MCSRGLELENKISLTLVSHSVALHEGKGITSFLCNLPELFYKYTSQEETCCILTKLIFLKETTLLV